MVTDEDFEDLVRLVGVVGSGQTMALRVLVAALIQQSVIGAEQLRDAYSAVKQELERSGVSDELRPGLAAIDDQLSMLEGIVNMRRR